MRSLSDSLRSFREGLQLQALWEYWLAIKSTAWEIVWGAGLIGIPFSIYTLYYSPSKVVILSYLLLIVFLSGYFIWHADHIRLQQKIRITRLRCQSWTDAFTHRLATAYYFEVVNESEALTIHEVRVQLAEIVPEVANLDWLPVPLHQKHDNNPNIPRAQTFSLNPREPKLIDLVSAFSGDAHFDVRHIAEYVNQSVPAADHHRLKVTVTAEDMPVQFAWFDVWMDEDRNLQCQKIEET